MLSALRDISIILLALESIVIGIILLLLLWQVRLLVLLLRDEIKPILENTQETTKTLQSTTKFVGRRVTKPVVDTISFFAGAKQVIRAMTDPIQPSGSPKSKPQSSARQAPTNIAPSPSSTSTTPSSKTSERTS